MKHKMLHTPCKTCVTHSLLSLNSICKLRVMIHNSYTSTEVMKHKMLRIPSGFPRGERQLQHTDDSLFQYHCLAQHKIKIYMHTTGYADVTHSLAESTVHKRVYKVYGYCSIHIWKVHVWHLSMCAHNV